MMIQEVEEDNHVVIQVVEELDDDDDLLVVGKQLQLVMMMMMFQLKKMKQLLEAYGVLPFVPVEEEEDDKLEDQLMV